MSINYISHKTKQKYILSFVPPSILTSPAVWAITAVHVSQSFGAYVLLTELPNYMKNVLHWDLKSKVMVLVMMIVVVMVVVVVVVVMVVVVMVMVVVVMVVNIIN